MARFSGDKSYQNLLVTTYQRQTGKFSADIYHVNTISPLNYFMVGLFNAGRIWNRNNLVQLWTPTVRYITISGLFTFTLDTFYPQNSGDRGAGNSLRCVAKSPLLSIKPARRKSPKTSQNLSQQSA